MVMVVGSSLFDHGTITRAGRVDIYRKSAGGWSLATTMYGSAAHNKLGASVAVNYSGTVVALTGSWVDGYDSTDGRSLTRVYGDVNGTWSIIGSEFVEP